MSLSRRLTLAMALVAGLLIVAGYVVVRTTTHSMMSQLDEQLVQLSGARPPGRTRAGTPGAGDPGSATDTGGTGGPISTYYRGEIVYGALQTRVAPQLRDEAATPVLNEKLVQAALKDGRPRTVDSTDPDDHYRVIFRPDPRDGNVSVFGLPMKQVETLQHRSLTIVAIAIGSVLALLALITWWVQRLGIRPLKRMTATAADIAAGDDAAVLPAARSGTEAAELGVALNQMLTRVRTSLAEREASEASLRRFVADASHELRTPVATIRGYAELYRAGALTDPSTLDAAMGRTEDEAIRMGNLVNDMLQLARLDHDRFDPSAEIDIDRQPVQFDAVVGAAEADFRAANPTAMLTVTTEPCTVSGDHDRLYQVVSNLLNNTRVHTPDGTPARVSLAPDGADAVLTVHDDGPGMDNAAAAQAFDRFFRADRSRARASGGTGLGLAIVRAITEAHGGTATISSAVATTPDAAHGTTVVIRLPLAAD
jgi:two-component system OmpR family sensor kinase